MIFGPGHIINLAEVSIGKNTTLASIFGASKMSIRLDKIIPALPGATRNFGVHISYDRGSNCIAYGSGKSAIIRSLTDSTTVQFTGHGGDNVTVVKFSPIQGSKYVCSGDESGKVIVWYYKEPDSNGQTETGIYSEFKVLSGAIKDISWCCEGQRLCVVGEGNERFGAFISWDSGNSLGEVSGHSQTVNACDMKQSRPMRAFTVGDDGTAIMYKGPPFRFTSRDRTHHEQGKFIRDVRFSPGKGKYCVSVGSDRKIVVYDGLTGEFMKYVSKEGEVCGGLFALEWVDDGDDSKRFVTVGADGVVSLWDVETAELLQKWSLGNSLETQQVGVTVTRDKDIVSVSLDGTINIFKIGEKEVWKTVHGHSKGITSLAVNPLSTASYDGRVVSWSEDDVPAVPYCHSNKVISMAHVSDKTCTISWDKSMRVDGEIKYKFPEQPKVSALHEGTAAVVTVDNTLLILDVLAGTVLRELQLAKSPAAVTIGAAYVVLGYEGVFELEVFNVSDLSKSFVLSVMRAAPSSLSLSPSERLLAAGDTLGRIILYDLHSKTVVTSRWAFHTGRITSMSWRPGQDTEDHVVSAAMDTHMFIYSVKRPMRVLKQLNAHKEGVTAVNWTSPDGIVSVGADGCIKKWSASLS